MQTLEEVISFYDYRISDAKNVLNSIESHIGKEYGCNKITDIKILNRKEKDVELTCTLCGKVSHKIFIVGRNKWREIKSTCECQKPQNEPKDKVIRNDDPSFLGKQYGDYVVEEFVRVPHKNKSGGTIFWKCKCIHCKQLITLLPHEAKKNKECPCMKEERRSQFWASKIGERYGRLTVTGFEFKGSNNIAYALCDCDCGKKHICQYTALLSGQTKSCGCIKSEKMHGRKEPRTKSPLYTTWQAMRYRCNNPNATAYKDYGGRGIKVCDEWNDLEHGFERFEKWAFDHGYVPDSGLSLDRIDVNGNYEPGNCRYATVYVQTVNQRIRKPRKKIQIEVDGELHTKEEWCKLYNISAPAVDYRMKYLNMDFETALKTPKTRKGNIFAGEQAKKRVADINKCESYIEANLLLAFIRCGGDLRLTPQFEIGKYRVDFIVAHTNIVVECDGYYNHKTKEQIEHDYERDRYLIRQGFTVLRFSGSEINKDPDGCAKEIVNTVKCLGEIDSEDRQANAG